MISNQLYPLQNPMLYLELGSPAQFSIFQREISNNQIPHLVNEFEIYNPFVFSNFEFINLVKSHLKQNHRLFFAFKINQTCIHLFSDELNILKTNYKDHLFIEFDIHKEQIYNNSITISLAPKVYKNKPYGEEVVNPIEDLKYHIYLKKMLTHFNNLNEIVPNLIKWLNIPCDEVYSINYELDNAIVSNDEEKVRQLISQGGDINYVDPFYEDGCSRLMRASREGDINQVKFLLKFKPELDYVEPYSLRNAFSLADNQKIKELIILEKLKRKGMPEIEIESTESIRRKVQAALDNLEDKT